MYLSLKLPKQIWLAVPIVILFAAFTLGSY